MSAKDDSQVGLHSTIFAKREDVVRACERAVAVLGNHAEATVESAKVTAWIIPGFYRVASKRSPRVAMALTPGPDSSVIVDVRIEQYRTLQQRMFFIPVGPKRLVGKKSYHNLLRALEQEFASVGSKRSVTRWTGTTRP